MRGSSCTLPTWDDDAIYVAELEDQIIEAARQRLRDKAKSLGLACKLCGAKGHWKRECPTRQEESRQEASHFTAIDVTRPRPTSQKNSNEMPANAVRFSIEAAEVPMRARAGQSSGEVIHRFSASVQPCLFADTPK